MIRIGETVSLRHIYDKHFCDNKASHYANRNDFKRISNHFKLLNP